VSLTIGVVIRRIILLLLPSFISGGAAVVLTILILAANAWIYIDDNKYFYDFLFGSNGIVTAINHTPNDILGLVRSTFSGSILYYVLLVLTAFFVAVVVYELTLAIGRVQKSVQEVKDEVHIAGLTYSQAFDERLPVWGIRLVCGVVWALYWVIFLQILLPFGIFILQNGIDYIATETPGGWLSILISGLFVVAILHIHVICLRLVSLRLRVFDNK
jgi:hypothetical protein